MFIQGRITIENRSKWGCYKYIFMYLSCFFNEIKNCLFAVDVQRLYSLKLFVLSSCFDTHSISFHSKQKY